MVIRHPFTGTVIQLRYNENDRTTQDMLTRSDVERYYHALDTIGTTAELNQNLVPPLFYDHLTIWACLWKPQLDVTKLYSVATTS